MPIACRSRPRRRRPTSGGCVRRCDWTTSRRRRTPSCRGSAARRRRSAAIATALCSYWRSSWARWAIASRTNPITPVSARMTSSLVRMRADNRRLRPRRTARRIRMRTACLCTSCACRCRPRHRMSRTRGTPTQAGSRTTRQGAQTRRTVALIAQSSPAGDTGASSGPNSEAGHDGRRGSSTNRPGSAAAAAKVVLSGVNDTSASTAAGDPPASGVPASNCPGSRSGSSPRRVACTPRCAT